ncbi:MAG TPA: RNA polymerase sigma factor [Phycisphaerales bacterium]|nr:RNA polymerase sigma factor [Phycisphaerales bacterium]
MDQQKHQLELIERARRGDRQSLDELATLARERLRTYVYRMTQDDDLAQEIVQETLFEMCKALGKLKSNDRFWPWLHGIATNKLRRFYRTERTQRNLAAASAKRKGSMADRQDGLENLVSEELKGIVSAAIKRLRVRHKAVLIMRCYDGMTHSEIAESLGCSEFSTRMLFLRAKRALQRELARNGFAKGSLLTALVVFGKMTAPTEAAAANISVTAAATKVGLLAEVAVLATSRTAVVSMAAAGALTAGTIVAPSMLPRDNTPPPATAVVAQFGNSSNAGEQFRYYFPGGPDGPMMLRANSAPAGGNSERLILQNAQQNCDYQGNVVNVNNYRMWAADLSVPTLPTDDPAMVEFLRQVVPGTRAVQHIVPKGGDKHLLIVASRSGPEDSDVSWTPDAENALEEPYFQPDWPATAKVSDNRDEMHKRGWTYFQIRGEVNGREVMGSGRIPFVYATRPEHSPWLKLQVGSVTIVDDYRQAGVLQGASDQFRAYKRGSFFKGLARPWMGLHTIDTVRRDAAEEGIWFETRYLPDDDGFAQVELDCERVKIVYKINLLADVVDRITFTTDQGEAGYLTFEYLQSIEGTERSREFDAPDLPGRQNSPVANPGLLWLVQLVEDSFE